MAKHVVKILEQPVLRSPRMVMGFSGWMDGGDASTGTVKYLTEKFNARELAEIDPERFYIYNFPGSMEISSFFRPHTSIEDGLITTFEEPANKFYFSEPDDLILFEGKEPNLRWQQYADCIFSVAAEFHVTKIYFVGSVSSVVPHTRETRFHGSVSDERLKPDLLDNHGIFFSNYEGPASFVTYMMVQSRLKGLPMTSLVAEIPGYVQGRNEKCIEAIVRKLAAILGLAADFDDMKAGSRQFEKRLNQVLEDRPELADLLRKLEQDFDGDVQGDYPDDLEQWFDKQGLRFN